MSDNFDWRTEEEDEWDGGRPEIGSKTDRRRWILPLAIVIAVIAAAGVIYWQVQERVSAAEAAVRDDIISSFHLMREAYDEGDIELFRNLLSGSDLGWAVAQQDLFSQGTLFDLSPFGLGYEPTSPQDIQVTLAPGLNSAEVTAVVTYMPAGGVYSDSVQLSQTSVYRQGQRWVWSPPKDEFWQGLASSKVEYLSVAYPVRDERLALRLARDIDRFITSLCAGDMQLNCPDELSVSLTLSNEPEALVALGERYAADGLFGSRLNGSLRRNDLHMTLPTPSLLGTPVDDRGYEVLLNGYGTQVIIALVDRLIDQDCCGTLSNTRAATRKVLQDVGLNVWSELDGHPFAETPSLPSGNQVALLCSSGFGRTHRLFTLNPARMAWQQERMEPELLAIKSAPDGNGVLLLGQTADNQGVRSQIWRHSAQGSTLLLDLPVSVKEAEQISWELQQAQNLLVVEVPESLRGYSRYFTIDLDQCDETGCPSPPASTVNRPVWSPDGSELLVRAYGLLWWRVGPSLVPIADGTAPFWVDDETYGYARSFGREQALVVVPSGDEESEHVVLTTGELRQALPPTTRPNDLLIGRVIVSRPAVSEQGHSEWWLILAFEIGRDGGVDQARFFAYEPANAEVRLVPHSGRLLSFNIGPSGDKMALAGFLEDEGRWEITISGRDPAAKKTVTLAPGGSAEAVPSYAWSQDEAWLLVLEQGLLTLFDLENGTSQLLKSPDAGCVQAAWYGIAGEP